jgi:hypothetical protein
MLPEYEDSSICNVIYHQRVMCGISWDHFWIQRCKSSSIQSIMVWKCMILGRCEKLAQTLMRLAACVVSSSVSFHPFLRPWDGEKEGRGSPTPNSLDRSHGSFCWINVFLPWRGLLIQASCLGFYSLQGLVHDESSIRRVGVNWDFAPSYPHPYESHGITAASYG